MSASEDQSPKISFEESDERPWVATYVQKPKFHVGDKVYLLNSAGSREGGPYYIASVSSAQKCTLCLEDGRSVKNGEEVDMENVVAA